MKYMIQMEVEAADNAQAVKKLKHSMLDLRPGDVERVIPERLRAFRTELAEIGSEMANLRGRVDELCTEWERLPGFDPILEPIYNAFERTDCDFEPVVTDEMIASAILLDEAEEKEGVAVAV